MASRCRARRPPARQAAAAASGSRACRTRRAGVSASATVTSRSARMDHGAGGDQRSPLFVGDAGQIVGASRLICSRPHCSGGNSCTSTPFSFSAPRASTGRRLGLPIVRIRESRQQCRTLQPHLLQAVIGDPRRGRLLELRRQVPQQDAVERPLEQPEPIVGGHQLLEAGEKFAVLQRTSLAALAATCQTTATTDVE